MAHVINYSIGASHQPLFAMAFMMLPRCLFLWMLFVGRLVADRSVALEDVTLPVHDL